MNPNAIYLLEKNPEKIDWGLFSKTDDWKNIDSHNRELENDFIE
jgi:hypothetical protein